MRFIYTFLLYLLLPFVLLRLWIKGRKNPLYRQRWHERFGSVNKIEKTSNIIWLHAVSVGEVEATAPLVARLFKHYPGLRVILTTTTPTGAETVLRRYADQISENQITHSYLPYDLPIFLQRFLDRIQPDLVIIMETEVWPNLVQVCRKNAIPVILANARMAERSCQGYLRLGSLARDTFADITAILAQTDLDAERFRTLGADRHRVSVTGSLKFDLSIPSDLPARSQQLRQKLGEGRPVWIAGSTHAGEEEQILLAHQQILNRLQDCLLILVPRHPERFDVVSDLCAKAGIKTVRRSQHEPAEDAQIYLVDTMGDLLLCYAAADIAFVGGSLVAVGGHNILEPASFGIPVIMGPYTFKIEQIFQEFTAADAVCQVEDAEGLARQIMYLFNNRDDARRIGGNGLKLVEQNKGSADRHIEVVNTCL